LEQEGEKIALIGVENTSFKNRFQTYGSLEKAYKGSEIHPFKILLSHDPSHWDGEINSKYKDIDLTLSGHTHGFQFGIDIPWLKWSPVQYVYKQWAGLYQKDNQHLYVNRGFGFLGYPGRVGIMPEITVIELV
jgi:predicted MPP superfamily phosphohydrolase